jgi:hypothetical protein
MLNRLLRLSMGPRLRGDDDTNANYKNNHATVQRPD